MGMVTSHKKIMTRDSQHQISRLEIQIARLKNKGDSIGELNYRKIDLVSWYK